MMMMMMMCANKLQFANNVNKSVIEKLFEVNFEKFNHDGNQTLRNEANFRITKVIQKSYKSGRILQV